MKKLRRVRLKQQPRERTYVYLTDEIINDVRAWSQTIDQSASSFMYEIIRHFTQVLFILTVCFDRANGDAAAFGKEIEALPPSLRKAVYRWSSAVLSIIPVREKASQAIDAIFEGEETLH